MINSKKIISAILKSIFSLLVVVFFFIFFYSTFFYKPSALNEDKLEEQISKSEDLFEPKTEGAEDNKIIEETEGIQEFEGTEENKEFEVTEESGEQEEVEKSSTSGMVIKDSLFVTVGNKALTYSDIINEIKIILILNNQVYSDDQKEMLQSAAMQSAIKRTIKQIEIEKYNLAFNQEDLNNEMMKMANNINMDIDTFQNTFTANGIRYEDVVEQMKTELLWNSLIFEIYKDRLSIDLEEIEEQLKLVNEKREVYEYLISEIILENVPKDELENRIKEIKNKIQNEGFKQVALSISIAETAIKGGDLGWINENQITEIFKKKIINTPVGQVSEPVLLPDGIIIFKVRDKRKIEGFVSLEAAKEQLIAAEKSKILGMHSLSHYDNLRRTITINYY